LTAIIDDYIATTRLPY